MKQWVICAAVCVTLAITFMGGCVSGNPGTAARPSGGGPVESDNDSLGSYAIVPKSSGTLYNEMVVSGFLETIRSAGGDAVVSYPEEATAEAQIACINSLISRGVDSITVSASDTFALSSSLQSAMDAGIHVSCFDSAVNPIYRETFANQADVYEVAQALCDSVLDISGGTGQWAILSTSSQSANQNAWIDAMISVMENDPAYNGLELVDIAYGNDDPDQSMAAARELLTQYPQLCVICAPTSVGIVAASQVIKDSSSDCRITGLGLPTEMSDYISEEGPCPYMFLWSPVDLGRLCGYISLNLVSGRIDGSSGDYFTAPLLEKTFSIQDSFDGGTEVTLGSLLVFDENNIEDYKGRF